MNKGLQVRVVMSSTSTVRARLTPKGLEHFEQFFADLAEGQQQPRAAFPLLPTDSDGYHHFPLWMFASVFGGLEIRRKEDFETFFKEGTVEF